jgi:cleavage and polyadenylation specificity factor subunit 2
MSIQVKFTPIAGGRNDVSGVCSILEIGPFTLLLDCGCSIKNSNVLLSKIKNKLSFIGKSIDAVILSHADLQHLGALPVVLGPHGIGNPQIVCTLPVHKFGQLVLYDYCSNKEMEGMMDIKKVESNNQTYGYDDIDDVFLHPTVVKFSQIIELSSVLQSKATLSLCAYPSGRTIGGAIWRIWYGSTEILYAVDINMKNEIVLSGASLHPLPTVPSLLIMDAGTSSQLSSIKPTNKGNTLSKKKKDKDDPQGLISTVMETLRNEGNVLIPCETAGRSLELFQILGNHWSTNKIGLYHLIFLSPMAYNVLEFARSQLEWMSDNLSKAFYNGGPNPFYLPSLKISTSLRDVEKNHPGPKVVLCTDASLSCGLSKEVLLRWGGDPRCKIIFTDISDQNSLAYELRSQVPPIVATISRPIRVELTGEELQEHRNKLDKVRKDEEEKAQRLQRESELEFVNILLIRFCIMNIIFIFIIM